MSLFSQIFQHAFDYRCGFNPFLVNKSLQQVTKSQCLPMRGECGCVFLAALEPVPVWLQESDGVRCVCDVCAMAVRCEATDWVWIINITTATQFPILKTFLSCETQSPATQPWENGKEIFIGTSWTGALHVLKFKHQPCCALHRISV